MIKTSIFVIAQALINSHFVLFFPCYNFASIFHSLRKSRFSSFDSHPLISLARSPWKIECINLSIFSYLPYLKIERDRTMVKFCQDRSIYTRSHIRKYKEIILNEKRGKGNKKKDKKNVIKTVIHSSTNHPGQRNQCTILNTDIKSIILSVSRRTWLRMSSNSLLEAMWYVLLLLSTVPYMTHCLQSRIIGGHNASINDYPYQVNLSRVYATLSSNTRPRV